MQRQNQKNLLKSQSEPTGKFPIQTREIERTVSYQTLPSITDEKSENITKKSKKTSVVSKLGSLFKSKKTKQLKAPTMQSQEEIDALFNEFKDTLHDRKKFNELITSSPRIWQALVAIAKKNYFEENIEFISAYDELVNMKNGLSELLALYEEKYKDLNFESDEDSSRFKNYYKSKTDVDTDMEEFLLRIRNYFLDLIRIDLTNKINLGNGEFKETMTQYLMDEPKQGIRKKY